MTQEEINKQIEELRPSVEKAKTEYSYLLSQMDILLKKKLNPIPSYGDLMTLEDFIECVKCGGFIDDDGGGNYATETGMSNIDVSLYDIENNLIPEAYKHFTHVVWFNK